MIETIEFNGVQYPSFQADGNAAQFAIPFAKHFCKGRGVDVGCSKPEWAFPGAEYVDPEINGHTATDFPQTDLDYVFSSHCLEHVDDWVAALDYWAEKLVPGGVIFLYLPHYSQEYWRPWNNRKHKNILNTDMILEWANNRDFARAFAPPGYDLNNSFYVVLEKAQETEQ